MAAPQPPAPKRAATATAEASEAEALETTVATVARVLKDRLCTLLAEIEKNEENYDVRYALVFELLHVAQNEPYKYKTGVRIDPKDPEWPVFWVILPQAGEVSWHMPSADGNYDGYDTKEKHTRIQDYFTCMLWLEKRDAQRDAKD
ncbi:MAG: hypothetical protein ACTSX8_02775 [Alphaproteobacteria bacterium]